MFEDSYRAYREKQGELSYLDAIKANKITLAGYSIMAGGGAAIIHGLLEPNSQEVTNGLWTVWAGASLFFGTGFGIPTYNTMKDVDERLENATDKEEKADALYRLNRNEYCTRCAVEDVVERYGLEAELDNI